MNKKKRKKKKYLATYWRNDGGWHQSGYLSPSWIFEARNDKEALNLAVAYAIHSKSEREDFWLSDLREIRDILFTFEKRKQIEKSTVLSDDIKEMLDSCFEDL